MKRRVLLAGVVAAVAVAGAATVFITPQPSRPRLTIYLDQDKCKRCKMVISRKEFAAGLLAEGVNEWWKYDDIRCLMKDYIENAERVRLIAIVVYDYNTKEELDATVAYFVKADPKKLWTPMSSGIVAVKDLSSAEQIAHQYDGHVYSWHKIIEEIRGAVAHHG